MKTLAINGGVPVYNGRFPTWPQWGAKKSQPDEGCGVSSWGIVAILRFPSPSALLSLWGRRTLLLSIAAPALELICVSVHRTRRQVIVSPYTFSATVSAIAYVGAMPVFADVDERTGNIDAESVTKHITAKTKAVMAVHVGGYPCDMDALKAVTSEHGLLLLEDCAHAHGSSWRKQMCGSIGDAAGFSFQNSKVLPAGEGG